VQSCQSQEEKQLEVVETRRINLRQVAIRQAAMPGGLIASGSSKRQVQDVEVGARGEVAIKSAGMP